MKSSKILIRTILAILIGVALFLFFAPFYLKQSLTYWYPNLDDYKIFANNEVVTAHPTPWQHSYNYNTKELSNEDIEYLEAHKTTAFVIIQNGKIRYERYWRECTDSTASNMFSVTKSIVSLCVGIAIEEGKLPSVNTPIGDYIPEFSNDDRGSITIRNLLTMSSGLDWDEQYSSPFSITTQAYYGNNLRELVTGQKCIITPGKYFKYLSGNTQLLAYVVEKATGTTISEYAQEKIWKLIGAEHRAIWSKDGENGDERAFCCFHTNAKDIARIGQLVLNKGRWNGKQVIPEQYITEATSPAKDLLDKNGKILDFYGYQWWILHTKGMEIPYMRGHKGQYIYSIPEKNAVVVRLGEEKDDKEIGYITTDIVEYVRMALSLLE